MRQRMGALPLRVIGVLIAIPLALIVIGVIAFSGGTAALGAVYSVPENEMEFPHDQHVTSLAIECEFCHRAADTSRTATVPSVEQCMFCHKAVATNNPNLEPLRAAWESGEPLNWIRQHRLPDHTQFRHEPHITAGFECSECHGDVGSVRQVEQVRILKMGDCVGCHKENSAPTTCSTCHS